MKALILWHYHYRKLMLQLPGYDERLVERIKKNFRFPVREFVKEENGDRFWLFEARAGSDLIEVLHNVSYDVALSIDARQMIDAEMYRVGKRWDHKNVDVFGELPDGCGPVRMGQRAIVTGQVKKAGPATGPAHEPQKEFPFGVDWSGRRG